jgi:hypothetical protein
MKVLITLLILFISLNTRAQQTLDTIYANEHKNVALFFPKPIRQGIVGNEDFVFTYNRELEQYFGLLQAKSSKESNLLAITNDGQIYSYILKYREQLTKLNYFIKPEESLGNERPFGIKTKLVNITEGKNVDRIRDFQQFSEFLLNSTYKPIATKYKRKIKLQLQKMVYKGSEMYMVLEIGNKSQIDYEIGLLDIYKTTGNEKMKSSYQRLPQKKLYKHSMPYVVKKGTSNRFVYTLPKDVLGENEKFLVVLNEENGRRNVILQFKQ